MALTHSAFIPASPRLLRGIVSLTFFAASSRPSPMRFHTSPFSCGEWSRPFEPTRMQPLAESRPWGPRTFLSKSSGGVSNLPSRDPSYQVMAAADIDPRFGNWKVTLDELG